MNGPYVKGKSGGPIAALSHVLRAFIDSSSISALIGIPQARRMVGSFSQLRRTSTRSAIEQL